MLILTRIFGKITSCYDEVMQDLERIIGDTRFTSIGIEAPRSHVQSSACTLARDIG